MAASKTPIKYVRMGDSREEGKLDKLAELAN
jgi:hypothetical protein